jgi:hypothetical protein
MVVPGGETAGGNDWEARILATRCSAANPFPQVQGESYRPLGRHSGKPSSIAHFDKKRRERIRFRGATRHHD